MATLADKYEYCSKGVYLLNTNFCNKKYLLVQLLTRNCITMEKAVNYEMQERREGDNLQLISGSVATNPPEAWDRSDRKEAKRTSCMQQCCMLFIAMIAVLALCAAVAAIVLVLAYPNVANLGVQELLVIKDQLTAQVASTSAPNAANLGDEIQMIREILQTSLNSIDASLQASLNSIGVSIQASLNATGSSIKASMNSITSLGDELRMIREALDSSLTSTQSSSIQATLSSTSSSIESSVNTISTTFAESVNSMSTLLERLVEGEIITVVR